MRSADQKKTLQRVHQVIVISLTNNTLAFLIKIHLSTKARTKIWWSVSNKKLARGGVSFTPKPANDQHAREASLAGD